MSFKKLVRNMLTRPFRSPKAAPARRRMTVGRRIEELEDRTVPALLNYFPADGTAIDVQGGNNGTLFNGATFAPGIIGAQAFSFDGVGAYAQIARSVQNDFTLAAWIKTTTATNGGTNFFNGHPIINAEVGGVTNDFGTTIINRHFAFGIGAPDTTIEGTTNVVDGLWHHVAAVRQGNAMRIYVDGVLENSTTTTNVGPLTSSAVIDFGGLPANNIWFPGSIDDVRIYDEAVPPTAIKILAQKGGTQTSDFTAGQPAFLEVKGPSATFAAGQAQFNSPGNRTYLRTIAGDYVTKNFVAEVDLVTTGTNSIAFFGMGDGQPNPSNTFEPSNPTINLRLHSQVVASGLIHSNDAKATDPGYGNILQILPSLSTNGLHRLRLTWDAVAKTAKLEIDQNYAGGTFVADDTSAIIDGSDNLFTSSNAHIFFGGDGGTSYDNLIITSSIPPIVPTLSATLVGGNLTIADTDAAGKVNNLTASSDGTNLIVTDAAEAFFSAPAGGTLSNANKTLTIPLASIAGSITFNTAGANDSLTANLAVSIGKTINYNGGSQTSTPGDRLIVTGGTFATVTETFTNASDGQVTAGTNIINYTGLEPVDMTGTTAGNLVFNLPAAASTAFLEDDGTAANGISRLRSGNATFETTTFSNPTGSITINRGNAADTLSVTALPDLTSSVNIGASASPFATLGVAGTVALGSGQSFTSFGAATTVSAAVSVAGAGAVSMTADNSIVVSANITGGTGGTTLLGKGTAALNTVGVTVQGGAVVTATGAGTVTVTGTGGGGAANALYGVVVTGVGSKIASGGGTVSVTGTGGAGNGNGNVGVYVVSSAAITSGSNGTVTVLGTGGAGTGTSDHGVLLDANSLITSGGTGAVSVTGIAKGTGDGRGVWVFVDSQISSGGGDVAVNGSGGLGTGINNYGINLNNNNAGKASVTSGGNGNVSVTGTGGGTGASTGNHGIILDLVTSISAGGTGTVAVQGTGGGAAGSGGTNHGVFLTASGVTITSNGGAVSVTGTGGNGTANNLGVIVQSSGSIASPAALTVTGTKGANTTTGISVAGAGNTLTSVGLAALSGPSGSNILIDSPATANFGSLTVNTTGTATIFEDSQTDLAGTSAVGTLSLTSAALLTNLAAASLTVTNNASFSGTSIDLGNQAGDTMNFGSLTFNSGGAVNISEDSSTSLTGTSTANSLALTSAADITNTAAASLTVTGLASFTGTSVTLGNRAGDAMNFGSLTVSSTGAVSVDEDSDMAVNTVTGTTIKLSSTGSILDNNGAALNLSGSSAVLIAAGSVGAPADPLETAIANLEGSAGNGFFVSNTGDLIVGGIGTVNGVSATGGNISVFTAGNLTVNEPVNNTGSGTVTLNGGNLTIASDIAANGGNIFLTAAGSITETGAGKATTSGILTASSVSGETLNGANAVGTFNATNATSGNVSLVNTAANFTISGISETGGTTTVSNTGSTTISGTGIASTGAIQVSTTANSIVSSAVASSGASASLAFGLGGAGNTALINAPITGTSATLTGGTGSDAINVNAIGATNLTVNGGGVPGGGTDTVAVLSVLGGTGFVILTDPVGPAERYVATVDGSAVGAPQTFHVNDAFDQNGAPIPNAVGAKAVGVNANKVLTYNLTANLASLTLKGGTGGDTYFIQYADAARTAGSGLPPVAAIVAGSGADTANLYGTLSPDTIDVGFTLAGQVADGAEKVTFNAALEILNAYGDNEANTPGPGGPPAVGDTFRVYPDASTAINLFGGNPTDGYGDTLQLNVFGLTGVAITNLAGTPGSTALPDGKVASNYKTVTWRSIETFPVPLGLGGSFDFQPAGSTTQFGFLPVLPTDSPTSGAYAIAGDGWVNAGSGAFDRFAVYGTAGLPNSPQLRNLLNDGEWGYAGGGSNNGVFQVSVSPNQLVAITAFVGDTFAPRDRMNVYVGTPASPLATKLNPTSTTLDTTGGQHQFVSYTGLFNPGASSLLRITIETTLGGTSSYWTIEGLDVRPLGLIAPLAIAPNVPLLPSDGYSIDAYSGTGAVPNAELTINPQFGTPLSGAGLATDADPSVKGFQVVADAVGNFSFSVRRPTGIGPSPITVTDVTGASGTGNLGPTGAGPVAVSPNPYPLPSQFTQTYALPTVRRLDFGPSAAPVAAGVPPYISFDTSVYVSTSANALGWIGTTPTPGTFDRGAAFNALQRDGVFGTAFSDFELDMPLPSTQYSFTALLGDMTYNQMGMYVQVVNAAGTTVLSTPAAGINTPAGQSASVTFTAASDGTGIVRLRFGTDTSGSNAFWSLQALEARPIVGGGPGAQLGLSLSNGGPVATYTGPGAAALAGTAPADGITLTTYSFTGATAGALVTIATSLGTLTSPDGGSTYTGIQILANGSGGGTFTIASPYSTTALSGTISIAETTGASLGVFTQNYAGFTPPPSPPPAVAQRFDFNVGSSPTLAAPAGFIGVLPSAVYTASAGFGWKTAVNGYDRGSGGNPTDLYRDGAYGQDIGVFQVGVTPGASRDVRFYYGDPYRAWEGMSIKVEGNPTAAVIDPMVDQFGYVTVSGTDSGDGILDITILGGIWVASGLDVAAPGQLPAPATPAANPLPTTGRRLEFASTPSTAGLGFTAVNNSVPYAPGTGYGWASPVGTFTRPTSQYPASSTLTNAQKDFYGSGAYGYGLSTFLIAVPPGNPTATYSIRTYVADPYYNWQGITIQAENAAAQTVSASITSPTAVTFTNVKDLNGDGIIWLSVTGSPWVLNGLDVVPNATASLPAAP